MKRYIDLTGQKFNLLSVVSLSDRKSKCRGAFWNCVCDCGNQVTVMARSLKTGHTVSCGCWHRKESGARMRKRNTTHGKAKTRLYSIWATMKTRCYNPHSECFSDYGGRGISVCGEWSESYQEFDNWAMANGYAATLTIERIDNNGNYCPDNCTWIILSDQSKNRRDTVFFEINGKKYCRADAAKLLGVKYSYLRHHPLGNV